MFQSLTIHKRQGFEFIPTIDETLAFVRPMDVNFPALPVHVPFLPLVQPARMLENFELSDDNYTGFE